MVKSIANQEAIECFIRKVDKARKQFNGDSTIEPECLHTSPSEHYHIAESSEEKHSVTAWLNKQANDPSFRVRSYVLQKSSYADEYLQNFLP